MSSVSASIKTRSVASASSRSSSVRREAELAKLRLAQQRQQSELERQLHEAEPDAERQRQEAERQQQEAECQAERRRQDIERQLKEAALAQEAELLEQEGEVGEDGGVCDGDGDSGAQPSVAARRRSSSDPAPQPLRDTEAVTDRTSRWVNSHGGRPLSPERTSISTWIDCLDPPGGAGGGSARTDVGGHSTLSAAEANVREVSRRPTALTQMECPV